MNKSAIKRFVLYFILSILLVLVVLFSTRHSDFHFDRASVEPIEVSEVKIDLITAKDVLNLIPTLGAKVTIINIWATWCAPCLAEFPVFVNFYNEFKDQGVRLIFISADFKSEMNSVKLFLANQGVSFQTYMKEDKDQAFIETLHPKWTGALPTTFIYDGLGKVRHFLSKPLERWELEKNVLDVLNSGE